MRLHRFFVKQDISPPELILDDKEILHQLKNVFRVQTGQEMILFNGNGGEYLGKVVNMEKNKIFLRVEENPCNKTVEPKININLCQALIKKDNFEWVIQKGTEVGVSFFTPVLAERSEKKGLNQTRLEKIAQEAAEQSGRLLVPQISEIKSLSKALKELKGQKILLDASGESVASFAKEMQKLKEINVFVGPEGGWSQDELLLARENGAKIINLGPRILRSETAGIVAATIVLNAGII